MYARSIHEKDFGGTRQAAGEVGVCCDNFLSAMTRLFLCYTCVRFSKQRKEALSNFPSLVAMPAIMSFACSQRPENAMLQWSSQARLWPEKPASMRRASSGKNVVCAIQRSNQGTSVPFWRRRAPLWAILR